jgi:hypothetical protein
VSASPQSRSGQRGWCAPVVLLKAIGFDILLSHNPAGIGFSLAPEQTLMFLKHYQVA